PAIAELITRYSAYAARRKPELLDANSYPLGPISDTLMGGEFGAIAGDWEALADRARKVEARIPAGQRDAWFQLLGYPIYALSNLYRMNYALAWNHRLAAASDPFANSF